MPILYPATAGSTSPVYQQRRLADGTDKLFYMGAGSPCFDRVVDAAGRAVVGHLVEVAQTNRVTQNRSPSLWAVLQMSVGTTSIACADGTNRTTIECIENSATAEHYVYAAGAATNVAGRTTMSAALKSLGARQWVAFHQGGTGHGTIAWFDLVNGVKGTVKAGISAESRMTALGGGWYLCSASFTTPTAAAGNYAISPAGGDGTTVNGNNIAGINGASYAIDFAQWLETSDYHGSPIVTAASAVARAAAVCTYSLANVLPRAEGTLLGAVLCRSFTPSRARVLFSLSDGTTTNEIQVFTTATTGLLSATSRGSGLTSGDVATTGSIFDNAIRRFMLSWREGSLRLWLRSTAGVWQLAEDTTVTPCAGATFTTLSVGHDGAGANQAGPGAYPLSGWQILDRYISDPLAARSADGVWESM